MFQRADFDQNGSLDREEFEDVLEGLAEALHERVRLRLVGPLAPYDFVEEPGWD